MVFSSMVPTFNALNVALFCLGSMIASALIRKLLGSKGGVRMLGLGSSSTIQLESPQEPAIPTGISQMQRIDAPPPIPVARSLDGGGLIRGLNRNPKANNAIHLCQCQTPTEPC